MALTRLLISSGKNYTISESPFFDEPIWVFSVPKKLATDEVKIIQAKAEDADIIRQAWHSLLDEPIVWYDSQDLGVIACTQSIYDLISEEKKKATVLFYKKPIDDIKHESRNANTFYSEMYKKHLEKSLLESNLESNLEFDAIDKKLIGMDI